MRKKKAVKHVVVAEDRGYSCDSNYCSTGYHHLYYAVCKTCGWEEYVGAGDNSPKGAEDAGLKHRLKMLEEYL